MENIKIIGLGGIGSDLSDKISKFLNYSDCEAVVSLVDGDFYEIKNKQRQNFNEIGNKALVKTAELSDKYGKIKFESFPYFVDNQTISKLIKNEDTIFLAVDNHKTRKIVNDATESLKDVIIISGGNELVDGNVQIFIKKRGEKFTPSLTDYHPEIANPVDKLPSEMSCEELIKSEPQLLFTNLTVATCMTWAYYNILIGNELFVSEIYFDISKMKLDSKQRKVRI